MVIEEVLQNSSAYLRQEYSAKSTWKKLTAVMESCAFIVSPATLVFPLCFQLLESVDFKIIFLNICPCVCVCLLFHTGGESYENVMYFLKSQK